MHLLEQLVSRGDTYRIREGVNPDELERDMLDPTGPALRELGVRVTDTDIQEHLASHPLSQHLNLAPLKVQEGRLKLTRSPANSYGAANVRARWLTHTVHVITIDLFPRDRDESAWGGRDKLSCHNVRENGEGQ